MKTGYDQFFKNARKAAGGRPAPVQMKKSNSRREPSAAQIENRLLASMGVAPKRKRKFPWGAVIFCFVGLGLSALGFQYRVQLENFVKNVEVSMLGTASAEEKSTEKSTEKKPTDEKSNDSSKKDETKSGDKEGGSQAEAKAISSEDLDHLSKLNDRKSELDAKEEELARQEQELQAQRAALEKRMNELEDMRRKISSVLEDRVKVDDQKVDALVQLYTNMRPPQAAKVFETLDEDLAVEVFSRMKKKNAADIMNLLKPEKAQAISEKLAGYKRR